ncbi:MAG TPA: phosphatidylinositol mannoside acyltransferase [Acidimicrobiales bacterium]|nr:phosphatidylinositol mannoside acyltransferase [Acidimicrobiales bacterium]
MPGSRLLTAFQAASAVAGHVPAPLLGPLARLGGTGAALPDATRRFLVARHLQRVDPGLSGLALRRAVNRTFESYAAYWLEAFRLPSLTPAELDAGMSYEGYEHLERSLHRGRGTILVLPHLGGWEWTGFWFTRVVGVPITAVVERLEPPELFEWFVDFRTSLGMHIVPLGPDAGREVLRALKRNDLVCLLSDRDIDGSGVEVTFFGERTTLPAGPATLALRTGADLVPGAMFQQPRGGHHAVVRPPLVVERRGSLREDVARITQDIADALESLIRIDPTQWHLMSPNWPSDHEALAAAGLAGDAR